MSRVFWPRDILSGGRRVRRVRSEVRVRVHGHELSENGRMMPEEVVNELVRQQRARVEAEMEALGGHMTWRERYDRGLLMGDALKICDGCGAETCRETGKVLDLGWVREPDGAWTCPKCRPPVTGEGEERVC
jgi:hypothetical protein